MPAKKTTKPSEAKPTQAPHTAGLVQDSAQQIWLAGLGAFAKAQEEGSKAFQGLVKEGLSLQRQTKAAAEEKLAEASRKFNSLAEATTGLSSGMSASLSSLSSLGARAAQPWEKLESIFEERVAKALAHLGAPSAADMAALQAEVAALKRQVAALSGTAQPSKRVAKVPASKAKVRVRSAS